MWHVKIDEVKEAAVEYKINRSAFSFIGSNFLFSMLDANMTLFQKK